MLKCCEIPFTVTGAGVLQFVFLYYILGPCLAESLDAILSKDNSYKNAVCNCSLRIMATCRAWQISEISWSSSENGGSSV